MPRNLVWLLTTLFCLLLVGTSGYYLIEPEYDVFDSLYLTVITLSTVGYGETPHELSREGRLFTIFFLLGGVVTFLFVTGEVIRVIVSGEVQNVLGRRRMERSLSTLQDHFIVCGFGRMGSHVCEEFSKQGLPFVLIDPNPEVIDHFGLPHGIAVKGDATSDEVLTKARIDVARALVTVASTDTDNLFITLSARLLNEDLYIVARAESEPTIEKLKRAGANRVIAPYSLGGASIAQAVLRPNVVEFIDLATRSDNLELQMEEVRIVEGSALVGIPITETMLHKQHGIFIIAIKKKSGQMVYNPPGDTILEADDTLIVLGHHEELAYLARVAHATA